MRFRSPVSAFALALLAACGAPDFPATRPVPVRVNGFELDIYRAGNAVRVVNRSSTFRSEGDFVFTAVPVAERVTGCDVRRDTLSGGPGRITARLRC